MRYYTVSDVHGNYTLLRKALDKMGFFNDKKPHKLLVNGDLLDRGQEANQLIDFMIDLMEKDMLIFVKGNHEDLFLQCLQEAASGKINMHHYLNGTWDTLLQISEMSEDEVEKDREGLYELVRRGMQSPFYRKLLPACVDYYETPKYIFTHGWIPCVVKGFQAHVKYEYVPDWRQADIKAWYAARWLNGIDLACKHNIREPNKTVVCGHWGACYGHNQQRTERYEDADFSPFYAEGIIAIDASVCQSEQINCIVLDD